MASNQAWIYFCKSASTKGRYRGKWMKRGGGEVEDKARWQPTLLIASLSETVAPERTCVWYEHLTAEDMRFEEAP